MFVELPTEQAYLILLLLALIGLTLAFIAFVFLLSLVMILGTSAGKNKKPKENSTEHGEQI